MHPSLRALLVSLSLMIVTAGPASASAPGEMRGAAVSRQQSTGRAKLLLKVGAMKTDPGYARLTGALDQASRQGLGGLPGVRVLSDHENVEQAVSRREPPVILITGKFYDVKMKPAGRDTVVSAKVEYFVHRMPGMSIAAVVSGVARTKVASSRVKQRSSRDQLELELVYAAVASAVKRTAPALRAAVD